VRACGGPLKLFEAIAGEHNVRPEQFQILLRKALRSLLKQSQTSKQSVLPSRKILRVSLFLWIDQAKEHFEQSFDFLLVCRLSHLARIHNRFGCLGQRRLGFDGCRLRRRLRLGFGSSPALAAFRGFCLDSTTSLVTGCVTTGATLSDLTFPGSGAGGSTLMAAGGAGEEDADGELGNSPASAASGFCPDSITCAVAGGATTGAILVGFGFTVTGSGASGVFFSGASGRPLKSSPGTAARETRKCGARCHAPRGGDGLDRGIWAEAGSRQCW
jgi:hypothetical protein